MKFYISFNTDTSFVAINTVIVQSSYIAKLKLFCSLEISSHPTPQNENYNLKQLFHI